MIHFGHYLKITYEIFFIFPRGKYFKMPLHMKAMKNYMCKAYCKILVKFLQMFIDQFQLIKHVIKHKETFHLKRLKIHE